MITLNNHSTEKIKNENKWLVKSADGKVKGIIIEHENPNEIDVVKEVIEPIIKYNKK